MPVNWRTYTDLVSDQITAMVSNARATIDSSVGSITLSFTQAVAGVGLWLQGEVAQVLALTRAATSTGADLDSFYAEYNFFRLGVVSASGQLVFSRFTPTVQAFVPIGVQTTTGPSGLIFQVALDTSNINYDPVQNGYVLNIGVVSISVPASSLTAGSAGNVLANTIQSFFQSIPNVDTVNNPAPFAGGVDSETDPQFRSRFPFYLAGLQSADNSAIVSAILGTQAGIRYLLVENFDYPGLVRDPGNFFAVIDDGTGQPPQSLLTAVGTAINNVKALGTRYQVFPPVLITVNVSMVVVTKAGWNHAQVVGVVANIIKAFLNAVPLGTSVLPVTRLAQLAYDTSSGVANVPINQILINGLNADMALTQAQRPIVGTVGVT